MKDPAQMTLKLDKYKGAGNGTPEELCQEMLRLG
jgi:hypothetical protein